METLVKVNGSDLYARDIGSGALLPVGRDDLDEYYVKKMQIRMMKSEGEKLETRIARLEEMIPLQFYKLREDITKLAESLLTLKNSVRTNND